MENKIITENLELLKWFYNEEKIITDDEEKNNIFILLSLCYSEDPHVFLRIFKYIINKRNNPIQEEKYRIIIHFLCIMIPNILIANMDDFIDLGFKNDVIYYAKCESFTKHILKYVNYKAKTDKDFKQLITDGKLLSNNKKINIEFNLENNNYIELLEKILDEPIFNNTMF